tara:strand:- start:298 stop:975 length:678 start_codon:yes stop_codon:yes gene_type:complete
MIPKVLLISILFLSSFTIYAQRNSNVQNNRLGIQGKYSMLSLDTDNFNTSSGEGFTAGFTTRGAFYNNFDLIFGVDFFQSDLGIAAKPTLASTAVEDLKYKIIGAQVNILASYLIAGENFTIEAGPVLMINSKMQLDDSGSNNYIIDGYTNLKAEEIEEISRFNVNALVGLSAGFPGFRATVNYQYGLLNTLSRLENEDLDQQDPAATDFKGNLGIISAGLVIYL